MRRVLLLAPMTAEAAPVARSLGLRRRRSGDPHPRWSGRVAGREVDLVMVGVGTSHAAAAASDAIARVRPDHAVVCGIAGGVSRHLDVGDLVVPTEAVDIDTSAVWSAAPFGALEAAGCLLTSARFHSLEALEALPHPTPDEVLAIDMETAAVAEVCAGTGVPWSALRGLSDLLWRDPLAAWSLDLVREDGTTDVAAVLRHTARDPRRIADLARMGRGTAAAMATVSSALRQVLCGDALPM